MRTGRRNSSLITVHRKICGSEISEENVSESLSSAIAPTTIVDPRVFGRAMRQSLPDKANDRFDVVKSNNQEDLKSLAKLPKIFSSGYPFFSGRLNIIYELIV